MLPPAARGAFLKSRPPGPPEKLLFNKKLLRTFRGPGGGFLEKSPLVAEGIKETFFWTVPQTFFWTVPQKSHHAEVASNFSPAPFF